MNHKIVNNILDVLRLQDKENIGHKIIRGAVTSINIYNKKTKKEMEIYVSNDKVIINDEIVESENKKSILLYTTDKVIDFCES